VCRDTAELRLETLGRVGVDGTSVADHKAGKQHDKP
jgi:hypothetical protein